MKKFIFIYQLLLFFLLFFAEKAYADDKIIFLHIPKTGGVSVSSLLMNEYSYDQIDNVNSENIKLRAYGFHYSLFEIEKMIDISNFKLITFMRNPIDRILSEYQYLIEKHKGKPEYLIAHRLPAEGNPIETASNVVCKMLSGLDDKDSSIPIETHLSFAKKVLTENFFFIGITENMEESIQLLYSKLGWEMPEETPHFNKTNKKSFSDEVLQKIAERNWADIELYEYALNLYDQQKEQIARLSKHEFSDSEANYVHGCNYTFENKLKGSGWGIREISNTKLFRWATENSEAKINFFLKPDTYLFRCSILIQPIFYPQLTVLVNGTPISLKSNITNANSTQYEWVKCMGSISEKLLKKMEKTQIVFKMTEPEDSVLCQFYREDNQQQDVLANYIRGKFACQKIVISPPMKKKLTNSLND